jgi:nitrogen regulatory protein P-II 2
MNDAEFKLVTILCEPEIADRLIKEMMALGARGYSRYDGHSEWRRGRGADDSTAPSDWQGTHVRIETVVREAVADAILDRLATAYFAHYAVFAYVADVHVRRREKYL